MVALFVFFTIIAFISIDFIIQKVRGKQYPVSQQAPATTKPLFATGSQFVLPKGIFFYPGHTWAAIQPNGKLSVGIDDFAHKLVGKIDEIKTAEVGKEVKQGESIIEIRQGTRTLNFPSPVDGVVRQINQSVVSNPELLNANLYSSGWIYQMEPKHLTLDLPRLLISDKSVAWFRSELSKLRDFIQVQTLATSPVGVTALDGGVPVSGLLNQLDDQAWTQFQKEFLQK